MFMIINDPLESYFSFDENENKDKINTIRSLLG